ncbi:glyoxalase [Nitrospira sp. KM1]|nr:glyoxalase [Nitrospira sp. KM1]
MKTVFTACTPILTVRDITKAKSFFVHNLGFTLDFDWGAPPTYAGLHRDAVCIHLIQEGASRQKAGTGNITILSNEVDELFIQCQRNGVDIVVPPEDRPYGLRDFAFRDPDGNVINVGCDALVK